MRNTHYAQAGLATSAALAALLVGSPQYTAAAAGTRTFDLQAKGKKVESVVQFAQAPGEVEVVSTKQAD
ncbi:hypothetical protein ABZW03_27760, partial [Kitasatospora sp. NPDC004799]